MENRKLKSEELIDSMNGSQFKAETNRDKEFLDLVTYLYNNKLLNQDQAQVSLAEYSITDKPIGSILISNGFVSQKDYINAIIDFKPDFLINEESISDSIDFEILLKTNTMIQAETNDNIYVSTYELHTTVEDELKPFTKGKNLVFMPASLDQIDSYIDKISQMHYSNTGFVDELLRKALKVEASDIHIYPPKDTGSYSVFFRVDGVRFHIHEGSAEEYYQTIARIKDRSHLDIAEKRVPQDGSFQIESKGKYIDIRVATIPHAKGDEIVVNRLLDPDRVKASLNTLGISEVEEWRKGVSRPDGLALICGPTGSGKTTTLEGSKNEMDRFGKAIYEIADPIEYHTPYTGQVNVNDMVGLDFNTGVKAFMRADPDIMVLGEIRDENTARNAIKAAQTGHLLIGTLHTNSIRGVVARLKDVGVSPVEITELLRTVLAQRLLRTFCTSCEKKGCYECNYTGYRGRTVVSECAYFNSVDDVQNLIDGKISWSTMVEDAVLKVKEGVTDANEVIRVFGEEGRLELVKQGMETE